MKNDILAYLGDLHSTSVEDDRGFISNLGGFVEGLSREDIKDGALILVENALDQIFQKHRQNIDRKDKQQLQYIRALCMELTGKVENENFLDRNFFNDVFSLGQQIIDFAPALSLAAGIIFFQNPPSLFG